MLFQTLSNKEKVEFFAKCQELLIRYHPESEFILTEENLEIRKNFALDFIKRYKGYVYRDATICVLYNKVKVEDPKNPIKVIKEHFYQEPRPDYNAYSIDFVVFRKLIDCIVFCKSQYTPQIKYAVFVKNNEAKIYETTKLLERLNGPWIHFQ